MKIKAVIIKKNSKRKISEATPKVKTSKVEDTCRKKNNIRHEQEQQVVSKIEVIDFCNYMKDKSVERKVKGQNTKIVW